MDFIVQNKKKVYILAHLCMLLGESEIMVFDSYEKAKEEFNERLDLIKDDMSFEQYDEKLIEETEDAGDLDMRLEEDYIWVSGALCTSDCDQQLSIEKKEVS